MPRGICEYCQSTTGRGENICFKCGIVHNKTGMTPGFLADVQSVHEVIKLRDDLVLDVKKFPAAALKWLYNAGIYDDTIQKQKIGYCTEANRVMVPAFDSNDVLHFYQMRHIEHELGNNVKYYSKGKLSDYTIHYRDFPSSDTVVIVEDHLSAIRVRKFYNVVALSGTKIKNDFCKKLVTKYSNFLLWLDADAPGQEATYRLIAKLKYYSELNSIHDLFTKNSCASYCFSKVNHVIINKDPKRYLDSEIQNIITNEVIQCD